MLSLRGQRGRPTRGTYPDGDCRAALAMTAERFAMTGERLIRGFSNLRAIALRVSSVSLVTVRRSLLQSSQHRLSQYCKEPTGGHQDRAVSRLRARGLPGWQAHRPRARV